jgi:hypothetical protein
MRIDSEGVWSVDLEQKKSAKPFEIDGAPYGSRTRLFRLKSQAKGVILVIMVTSAAGRLC